MTYHGMAYELRGLGSQSLHSTCGSHAPPGRLGKPTTEGRKTGEVESPRKRGMRNARRQGLSGTRSRTREKGIASQTRLPPTLQSGFVLDRLWQDLSQSGQPHQGKYSRDRR